MLAGPVPDRALTITVEPAPPPFVVAIAAAGGTPIRALTPDETREVLSDGQERPVGAARKANRPAADGHRGARIDASRGARVVYARITEIGVDSEKRIPETCRRSSTQRSSFLLPHPCTALIMSKIGRYIETIMPPTTTPSTTISTGSSALSSASTATSTSSS